MDNIKVSVTIVLPGSTMMSPQECGENPENYNEHCYLVSAKHFDKKTKKSYYTKEPLRFHTRKCVPAQQVINMSDDAYKYMTSDICPEWYLHLGGIAKWRRLPKETRLQLHLERTCQSLGGSSYTYVVFGD